jgi:Fe-S cluster assembly ATP-binding protein
MIDIKNLTLNYDDSKNIISNLNLTIPKGEIHLLMGKNGSGKSTLLKAIANDPIINKSGEIFFKEKNITNMDIDEIANEGIFLSFQNPISIDGVNNVQFIKQAVNSKRHYYGLNDIEIMDFMKDIKSKMKIVGFDDSFLTRNLNEGFSGGERKRNELLQMLMLNPDLILLDEIDSGVDIDGIKVIANTLKDYAQDNSKSILMVSHYEKIFDYIKPNVVHILNNGKISKSGDISLLKLIQEKGYDYVN